MASSVKKLNQLKVLKASKISNLIAKFTSSNKKDDMNDSIRIEPKNLLKVIQFLKEDSNFEYQILLDICGADYPSNDKRFEVVYHLLSVTKNSRLRIIVGVNENEFVPSVTSLFMSAGWYEREVWDLYGIKFTHNDDLRRILTDYGFEGHPLRKDFPLSGFKEVRYDEASQDIVYEDVYLTQEYRNFDTLSPWEGGKPNKLPGDEKATK